MDSQLANLLFACQDGTCRRRCLDDTSCGATGLICEAGLCGRASCATFNDCPSGQYCTSATNGRCQEYRTCQSTTGCPENTVCRDFSAGGCPPGFDCALRICQELPHCLSDTDCQGTEGLAYCQRGHCQPTQACAENLGCPAGLLCVASRCVPGGCRGHADCPSDQACTAGACRSAPYLSEYLSVSVSPRSVVLPVGGTQRLSLVAFTYSEESFPLASGTFSVVDGSGASSDVATVSPAGLLQAVKPGTARILAGVELPYITAAETRLTVLPVLGSGRRVTVLDATTGLPLPGVVVLGCDDPPSDAPCPAPVKAITDASGAALFPGFTGATASFCAASAELRSDGYPRYDLVSVAMTAARDVLLPLTENRVQGDSGFRAGFDFSGVHSSGELWIGFHLMSVGDAADVDLPLLFGEPYALELAREEVPVYVPTTVALHYVLPIGDFTNLKRTALGLAQPGRRAAVAFAGKTREELLPRLSLTGLPKHLGAMDYSVQAFTSMPLAPWVTDWSDTDSDFRCPNSSKCPLGNEQFPNYYFLPGFTHRPNHEQLRRTEVQLPALPVGFDTVLVSAVEIDAEAGLIPMGLAARTGESTAEDGSRTMESFVLQSGAPYGGAELGTPGVWAFAVNSAESRGSMSGRLVRGTTLPLQVTVPEFLPLPSASYVVESRQFRPDPARWAELAYGGVSLARVTWTGSRRRHVAYFPIVASAVAGIPVPEAPPEGGEDPAAQASAPAEVAALGLSAGVTPEQALDLPGPNLMGLSTFLDAYSRTRCW